MSSPQGPLISTWTQTTPSYQPTYYYSCDVVKHSAVQCYSEGIGGEGIGGEGIGGGGIGGEGVNGDKILERLLFCSAWSYEVQQHQGFGQGAIK